MDFSVFRLLLLIFSLAAFPALATPLPRGASKMEVSGRAKPISAAIAFCDRYPAECKVDQREPARIILDQKIWDRIEAVNDEVNDKIEPVQDIAHWGVEDRWDFAEDGRGDCEDYQLLKRRLLIADGLPRRAMRITVVLDHTGGGHAVLTLLTDRGDFILDNITRSVLAWDLTGYEFVKREGDADRAWVGIQPPLADKVASNH